MTINRLSCPIHNGECLIKEMNAITMFISLTTGSLHLTEMKKVDWIKIKDKKHDKFFLNFWFKARIRLDKYDLRKKA